MAVRQAVRRAWGVHGLAGTEREIVDLTFVAPGGAFSMIWTPLRFRNFGLVAVSLLVACTGSVDPGRGQGRLTVRADVSASAVATLVAEITAPDIPTPLIFNIPISGGVAAGTITIPAGSDPTVAKGGTVQFAATITDWNGNPTTGTIAWATLDPSIATVDATGLATGVGVGSTKIAATYHGATGTATVGITP